MASSDKNEKYLDRSYVTFLHYRNKQSGLEPLSK